jgi:cold shock CspA family protein
VSAWFPEGVLVSPDVSGTVFAHFSMIRDQTGWRGLEPGQRVAFTRADGGQDGCDLRAVDVYSSGEPTAVATKERPSGAG